MNPRQSLFPSALAIALFGSPVPALANSEPLCRALIAESAATAPRDPPAAIAIKAPAGGEAACLLEPADYARDIAQQVPVDVRNRIERAQIRVLGALAIDLEDLQRHAAHLGRRPVLVGNGLDDASLLTHCVALRGAGLSELKVLRGGIRTIMRLGGELDGNAAALESLAWISAAELARLQARTSVSVLALGTDSRADPSPGRTHWPDAAIARTGWSDLPKAARALAARAQQAPVVIIAPDEELARRAQAALGAPSDLNVLVLRGGLRAYSDYRRQQHDIAAGAKLPRVRACGMV